jgi:hypothetical protein
MKQIKQVKISLDYTAFGAQLYLAGVFIRLFDGALPIRHYIPRVAS